ncbi:MAG TPA: hypothetical protein PK398_01425 [Candidatus Gracilibacteria bacterium]|nr:hypothetical protein [Candidatus Gracilibacteria bacterium]
MAEIKKDESFLGEPLPEPYRPTVLEARAAGVTPDGIAWGIKNNMLQAVTDLEHNDGKAVVDGTDLTVEDIERRALAALRARKGRRAQN